MSSKPKIQIDCPKCQSALSIPAKKAGSSIVCPSCKRSFIVPADSQAEQGGADQDDSKLSLDDLDPGMFENVDELIEQHKASEALDQVLETSEQPDNKTGKRVGKKADKIELAADSTDSTDLAEEQEQESEASLMEYEEEFSLEAHLDSPDLKLGDSSASATTIEMDPLAPLNVSEPSIDDVADVVEEEAPEWDPSDEPIKLDVGSAAVKSKDIYAVSCRTCDSRIQVTAKDEGRTIDCPDCFSKLYIHGPSKRDLERMKKAEESEYELAPAEPAPRPVADNLGMEMETRDLLAPPTPDLFGDEAESAAAFQSDDNSKPESQGRPVRSKKVKEKPQAKYGSKEYWKAKVAEADQGDQRPEILTKETVSKGDYLNWVSKSLRAPEVLTRGAIAIIALGFMYWMSDIFALSYSSEDISYSDKVVGVAFPILLGGGAFGIALLTLGTTLSMVFQNSANGVSNNEDWPGFSVAEWWSPVVFFMFSFWLASIPGAAAGFLLSMATGASVWLLVMGSFSAFLFAPLLLLSACYNGSPHEVFAKKVVETYTTANVAWLHYLPAAFGAWCVFAIGVVTLFLPTLIFAFAGAAIQVVGLLIYGVVIGLFCGRYVTRLL